MKNKTLFLAVTLVFALVLCGAASADESVGGQNLTTVQNGIVSGGVYSDSYHGFDGLGGTGNNEVGTGDITYNYAPLPDNAQVKATLYVAVYSGHMQGSRKVNTNVTFNGNQIETFATEGTIYTYLQGGEYGGGGNDNSAFPGHGTGEPYLMVNDHTVRVTSDYLFQYDVTNQIQENNVVNVKTAGSFDGRIKLITLIAAYDDGDSDKIYYWINQGQDVASYLNEIDQGYAAVLSTTFNTSTITGTVESASLKDIYLASGNGNYGFPTADNNFEYTGSEVTGTFTNAALDRSNPDVQASYSGSDSWNVTNAVSTAADSDSDVTLAYARNFRVLEPLGSGKIQSPF